MSKRVSFLLAATLLLASGAFFAGVKPGDRAPALAIEEWHNTEGPLSLENLEGKVVLLDFWGVWCAPCRDAVPRLQTLQNELEGRPFQILSIHTPMKADQIEGFIDEYDMTVAIGVDKTDSPTNHGPYGKTSDRYGVLGFPTYVLIDANSRVHYVGGEMPRRQEIEDLLHSGESTGP